MKIDVVLVTYNRINKLKNTLSYYEKQSVSFRNLIVVNNNSSDGTTEYLDDWQCSTSLKFKKIVIHLNENKGGAGGFYEGVQYALKLTPDWIFVADDDAYPDENMMKCFLDFIVKQNADDISAVCGAVYRNDGDIDVTHRQLLHKKRGMMDFLCVPKEEYKKAYFEIDLFSYVGTFLNVTILSKVGCCKPEYFIYYDDTEHSIRMLQYGKILVVPSIRIIHDFGYQADDDKEKFVSWRHYYACRNYTHMLKIHYGHQGYLFFTTHWLRVTLHYYRHFNTLIMLYCALIDGLRGNLGIHPKYKPGFKFNS